MTIIVSGNQEITPPSVKIGSFKIVSTGLIIEGDPTYDEWYRFGETLKFLESAIQFALGDWLNYGETRFGDKYLQAVDDTGYAKESLKQFASVANRVDSCIRIHELPFVHHQIVAPLEPEQQRHYLGLSAENGLSAEKLKKQIKQDQREGLRTLVKLPTDDNYNILTGDLSLLYSALADNSVDLFFTDPPYHKDKTHLFSELAELAMQKLKPGGLLLTYSGQMHIIEVINRINAHIPYWWMFAIRHTGGSLSVWNRHVLNFWKPVIAFAKPDKNGKLPLSEDWIMDFQDGGGRDKQFHRWGQDASEATYWIEKLTLPNEIVCDPFVGGGSIPTACKLTGRQWIGTEVIPEQAHIARLRVAEIP